MSSGETVTVHSKDETKRVQRTYDRAASRYDNFIGLSERLFFGNGRSWGCEAEGLEVIRLERSKWGVVERLVVRKPL